MGSLIYIFFQKTPTFNANHTIIFNCPRNFLLHLEEAITPSRVAITKVVEKNCGSFIFSITDKVSCIKGDNIWWQCQHSLCNGLQDICWTAYIGLVLKVSIKSYFKIVKNNIKTAKIRFWCICTSHSQQSVAKPVSETRTISYFKSHLIEW